jgi:tripartite-type tricarboxylate transporter receptor subunit TctC
MKKRDWMSVVVVICFLVAGLICGSTDCQAAEKYPSRAIQVVIGYEPGSTDQILRPLIDYMAEVLGQPMSFVFKPGGSGSVGATYVANSKPDGYTLMSGSLGPMILSPLTIKGINYTLDDFIPICRVQADALAIVVKNDARWKTIQEFIDEAKKNPGKLNYSTSGVFGTPHIPMEMLQKEAGIKLTHIPSAGSAPAVTALLGGHVDAICGPMQAVSPHLKSGAFRALAFSYVKKVAEYPNVPLLTDLGYNIKFYGYNNLMAPKGTPADVVKTLISACGKAVQTHRKELDDHFKKFNSDEAYLEGEDLAKLLRETRDSTKQIIDEIQKSAK